MQSAGNVACVELGFSGGVFEDIDESMLATSIAPPWVGNLRCRGFEGLLRDCPGLSFGDTVQCGLPQRLVCNL